MRKMKKTIKRQVKAWGIILMAFIHVLSSPVPTHAFSLFGGDGNNGYFLSLTNDPENIRIVPTIVYDQHDHAQSAKKFQEWKLAKVNIAEYMKCYENGKITDNVLPKVEGGETGRTGWIGKLQADCNEVGSMKQDSTLAWTFPGFAGRNAAEDYIASETDMERAMWVSDTLVADFNGAITFVHNAIQTYGDKDLEVMNPNEFANMIRLLASHGRIANKSGSSEFSYHGVTFVLNGNPSEELANLRPPKGVSKDSYVKISVKGHEKDASALFIEYVDKGYRKGQELHNSLNADFKSIVEDSKHPEVKHLNWMMIVLLSNGLWSNENITFTNVNVISNPSKFEQFFIDSWGNMLSGLRQLLGMFSSADLITNGGTRGSSYYYGIMPMSWLKAADILHWIAYALAWMLIIGAIVKLLVQRNVAAINPSQRVDMINGIKNLMIVGFALSIYDVLFVGLARFNFLIVEFLSSTGEVQHFGKAPVGMGTMGSLLISTAYFVIDLYFNIFYISRAITVSILYAVGPLYVASIAFGEKYRQIFGNFCREMIGNIYVQTFQCVVLVFFVGLSTVGTLRGIESIVLLFSFIPLTRYFKESVGVSTSTADAMSGIATAAGTGLLMAGLMSRGGGGSKGAGGAAGDSVGGGGVGTLTKSGGELNQINQKSGKDFTKFGKLVEGAGKAAQIGAKGAMGAGQMMLGAGLAIGGAAAGMKGVSTVGGFMIGSGAGKLNAARHDAGLNSNLVKSGIDKFDSTVLAKYRLQKGNYDSADGIANPTPIDAFAQSDGSVMEMYNKSDFTEATGITGFEDTDNAGIGMDIHTGYVAGEGFVGYNSIDKGYEQDMGNLVDAFRYGEEDKIAQYKERGIMGVKIDSHTNKVTLNVDRRKLNLGDVYNSGDHLYIHRKNYGDNKGKYSGYTNPLRHAINPTAE